MSRPPPQATGWLWCQLERTGTRPCKRHGDATSWQVGRPHAKAKRINSQRCLVTYPHPEWLAAANSTSTKEAAEFLGEQTDDMAKG